MPFPHEDSVTANIISAEGDVCRRHSVGNIAYSSMSDRYQRKAFSVRSFLH